MRRIFVTVTIAALLGACSAHHDRALTTIVRHGPTGTVLVIGSGVTAGDGTTDALRDAWPRLVFNETFAVGSVFVNAATRDATFASASVDQTALARDVHPDTVLVWLGVSEVLQRTAPAAVGEAVRNMITDVRAGGARRILVATLPALDNAPPSKPTDDAIIQATTAAGARVVDLHGIHVHADVDGDVVATTEIHRAVADAFERALRSS